MEPDFNILFQKKKLLKFLFKLTKNQLCCYVHIFKQHEDKLRGTCVKDLMEERQTTRSIAQRQLHHFFKEGLVTREAITLEEFKKRCKKINKFYEMPEGKKGYTYVYHPISYSALLNLMENRLEVLKEEVTALRS